MTTFTINQTSKCFRKPKGEKKIVYVQRKVITNSQSSLRHMRDPSLRSHKQPLGKKTKTQHTLRCNTQSKTKEMRGTVVSLTSSGSLHFHSKLQSDFQRVLGESAYKLNILLNHSFSFDYTVY